MKSDKSHPEADAPLREHVYDGIKEYDHKLPNWWLYTLYGAIVWFIAHWGIYYKTDLLKTDEEKVAEAIGVISEKREKALADTLSNLSNESFVNELANNP
ncbi:MAG: cbb3-type cytochrome c oxidase N-terminal domain-containing protein, partial [Verrucomicrobiota bacterium JB023]|nr:cbb3-type cytochrome c oxidase N-terminal domain-containing protein [Verrucomicrobiota bacterium JB023]